MVSVRQNSVISKDEGSLEAYLSSSLGMVDPDPDFVGHLRSRLVHKPDVELEKPQYLAAIWLIGAGLFSGACLFWLLGRVYSKFRPLIRSGKG